MGDTEDIVQKIYTALRKKHHASGADRVNAYLAMREAERAEDHG